jgi:hypothetical protein
MTGPKHLWSGDWEDESTAADGARAPFRAPAREPAPAPGRPVTPRLAAPPPPARKRPAPPRSPRRRVTVPAARRLRRPALIGTAAVLLVAVVAYALIGLLRSAEPSTSTAAAGPAANLIATPAVPGARPVSWLGMELVTVAPGVAVVETVGLNTAGDRAGLEPGDTIAQIDGHQIRGAGDIAGAIGGLPAGETVAMLINRGSSTFSTDITLAAPPTAYP